MGRKEVPLARDGSPIAEFAFWLRDLRNAAGLTYEQLAKSTSYAVSTLQDACAGRRLPSQRLTLAVVEACDGDIERWQEYWAQIKRALDPAAPNSELAVAPPWRLGELSTPPAQPVGSLTHPVEPPTQGKSRDPQAVPEVMALSVSARGPRLRTVAALLAVAGVAVATAVLLTMRPLRSSSASRINDSNVAAKTEVQFHKVGAPSLLDPHDIAGLGPRLDFGKAVTVSCKMFAPSIGSVSPDGYWYRVSTSPWNNHYYVAANTFLNGDPRSGPYTHNTDFVIPDC